MLAQGVVVKRPPCRTHRACHPGEHHGRLHLAGRSLVDACVDHATRAGCTELTLWTNDVLVSARRIYEAAGFGLVDSDAHHSFGKDLVGQHWRLDLEQRQRTVARTSR